MDVFKGTKHIMSFEVAVKKRRCLLLGYLPKMPWRMIMVLLLGVSNYSLPSFSAYGQASALDSSAVVFNSIDSLPKEFKRIAPVTQQIYTDSPPTVQTFPPYTSFKKLVFKWGIKTKVQEGEPLRHIHCRFRQEHLDLEKLREQETAIDMGRMNSNLQRGGSALPDPGAGSSVPWCDEVTPADRHRTYMENLGFSRFPSSYKICITPEGESCESSRAHVKVAPATQIREGYNPPSDLPHQFQGKMIKWGIVACLDEAGEMCVPFGGKPLWSLTWKLPGPTLENPEEPKRVVDLSTFKFTWKKLENETGLTFWKIRFTQYSQKAKTNPKTLEAKVPHYSGISDVGDTIIPAEPSRSMPPDTDRVGRRRTSPPILQPGPLVEMGSSRLPTPSQQELLDRQRYYKNGPSFSGQEGFSQNDALQKFSEIVEWSVASCNDVVGCTWSSPRIIVFPKNKNCMCE